MDKKKLLIGTLCALIMIMAVGYALLAQTLTINGTANITSTWKIEITNITQKEKSTGATEKSKSYDALTANFDVGFTSPGDYITYEVEVTNSGTLDAVIERVNVVTDNNPAIIYTTSGIKRGDVIEHNSKKYLTVKIEYDSSITSQPQTNNNALTLQLFTAQNLGQVQPEYQTYSVGDKVTFAGSDWYVIKNSTANEDYVTLIKETILTGEELTSAYSAGRSSDGFSLYNYMYYYSSGACNNSYFLNAGCFNHNDYAGSKVKEFLEGTYLPTIDQNLNKLKEVEGYKIRLITKDEILETFDINCDIIGTSIQCVASDLPSWVNYTKYWTMTPYEDDKNNSVWAVDEKIMGSYFVRSSARSLTDEVGHVRPVINLLKSAIE